MTQENPENKNQNEIKSPEKGWKTVGIVSLIIIAILILSAGAGGFLIWKYLKKDLEKKQSQQASQEETTQTDKTDEGKSSQQTQEKGDTENRDENNEEEQKEPAEEPEEQILGIDATWKKYINRRLGFSIDFPRSFYYGNASCTYVTTGGDHSYRPVASNVETTVFSSHTTNTVYITHASYAELTGETVEGFKHFYSRCETRNNSWTNMENNYPGIYATGWKIIVEDARNSTELNNFIRSIFGSGCIISERTPSTTQPHVEDIKVSDSDADHSDCMINYMYVVKYHTNLQKVASWSLGQACTFSTTDYADCYYEAMKNSFRFLVP